MDGGTVFFFGDYIVLFFIVLAPLDMLHCGPVRCCLVPPRHTLPCIITHTDTACGISFHNPSALPVYLCCEYSFFFCPQPRGNHARTSHR